MNLLVKTFFAFCVGVGIMAGVQGLYLTSIKESIRSDSGKPQAGVPEFKSPFPSDGIKMSPLITTMKPLDTREFERLGVESAARRIDQQIRGAQNAVPLPPRPIPGTRF
jgi:hypothetical protein